MENNIVFGVSYWYVALYFFGTGRRSSVRLRLALTIYVATFYWHFASHSGCGLAPDTSATYHDPTRQ
jgi:hypothetical protein